MGENAPHRLSRFNTWSSVVGLGGVARLECRTVSLGVGFEVSEPCAILTSPVSAFVGSV